MMCVLVSRWNFYTKYTLCYVNNERKHRAAGKTGQDIKLHIIWWLGKMKIHVRCSVLIFEKLWYPATLFGPNDAEEYCIIYTNKTNLS